MQRTVAARSALRPPASSQARPPSSPAPPAASASASPSAFAEAGMNVMLNGFGDAAAIEATRAEHRGGPMACKTAYSAADMSKPDDIAADGRGRTRPARQRRRARQQRRHPARRGDRDVPDRQVGRHHRHQPLVRLPRHPRRRAGDEAAQAGAASSTSPPRTAWSPRPSSRPTSRPSTACSGLTKTVALETAEHGITVNAICPGYVLTPLVQKQIPETAKARGLSRGAGHQGRAAARPAHAPVRDDRADRRAVAVSLYARRRHRSPARRCPSKAAGPRNSAGPRGRKWNMQRFTAAHALPAATRPTIPEQTRSCSSSRAEARSAPTRPASTRRCTKPASSPTGSSARRSAPSMRA